jgi:phosphoribosylamine-glycine ligase
MQDTDCAGILELIDTDIFRLFEACIVGSFSDEISYIEQKNNAAVSVVLSCRNTDCSGNVIQNTDLLDESTIVSYTNNAYKNKYLEYEAKTGDVMVLTAVSGTHTSASSKVYDEIESINFKGMKFRHDICKIAPVYAQFY